MGDVERGGPVAMEDLDAFRIARAVLDYAKDVGATGLPSPHLLIKVVSPLLAEVAADARRGDGRDTLAE